MTPKLPRPAKRMILAHVVVGCPRGVEGESQRALEPKPTPRQLNRADGRKEGEKEGRERENNNELFNERKQKRRARKVGNECPKDEDQSGDAKKNRRWIESNTG